MNEKKEQMMPHEWALQLVTRGPNQVCAVRYARV